jgi:hypothetical protein
MLVSPDQAAVDVDLPDHIPDRIRSGLDVRQQPILSKGWESTKLPNIRQTRPRLI